GDAEVGGTPGARAGADLREIADRADLSAGHAGRAQRVVRAQRRSPGAALRDVAEARGPTAHGHRRLISRLAVRGRAHGAHTDVLLVARAARRAAARRARRLRRGERTRHARPGAGLGGVARPHRPATYRGR